MSSQTTKTTFTSLDQAKFLGQSTRTQMPLVSPLVTEIYSPVSVADNEGNPVSTDWYMVQQSNAGLLDFSSRQLAEASQFYRISRVQLAEFYKLRNASTKDLTQRHGSLRTSVRGSHGVEAWPLLGLESPISRANSAVRERCVDAARRMRNPELLSKLRERLPGSPALDFTALSQEMKDALEAHDQLVDNLNEAKKIRDEARVGRADALKRHRRVYVNVARIQEGLYRLAGLDELADHIRVTLPRRNPKPTVPDTTEPDITEPDTTEPDTTEPDTTVPDTTTEPAPAS